MLSARMLTHGTLSLQLHGRYAMYDLMSFLPSFVLFGMIVLTLILLPLLDDDRPAAHEQQQTDQIRLPRRPQ